MTVAFVYGFLLLLSLFRHGISVPLPSYQFYDEDTQNQGPLVRDDITESDSYERFPRNAFSSPYYLHQNENRWFPRSRVSSLPRRPNRRHFHLFHLTAKHPNAVSYHIIQKPAAARTITAPERFNSHSNGLYTDVHQQSHPMQSYYQKPTGYQSPGYPSPNPPPYGQTQTPDTTYQDILQEASNPMQFSSNPSSYANQQTAVQNDNVNPLQAAAKQFSLASADMNNMELASLIMYPVPSWHGEIYKKKPKSKKSKKSKLKKLRKESKKKMMKIKFHSEPKSKSILVNKLIKSEKDKEEEDDMDYDGSGSGDTWDEEDAATTDDQGYTTSKRSKIAHVEDTKSDSKSDKDKKYSSADKKPIKSTIKSTDKVHDFDETKRGSKSGANESDFGSGANESEFGSGYVSENDFKDDDDSNEKKEIQKLKPNSEEAEEQKSSGPLKNEDKEEGSGMQESEFGSGYVNEDDVKDDDSEDEGKKSKKKKSK